MQGRSNVAGLADSTAIGLAVIRLLRGGGAEGVVGRVLYLFLVDSRAVPAVYTKPWTGSFFVLF